MGVIRVLSPDLINRIAAGECVERPSSVIKELVENALDAGATQIDVTILDGGRELIRVADNGGGMSADDLKLAIHPHATSKIRESDDLFNIHTMGFRGEALASIGSVSRLAITSRMAESDVAHVIRVEGGAISGPEPTSGRIGTIVEVRDLFFSVPARRKFLKTNPTESGHITEQVARIALAYPRVGFTLRSQNRVVHELPPTDDLRGRIRDLMGAELADVLLPIARDGSVRVEGLVAPPRDSRGSGKWEYVFVNGRYIRDKFVSHAIKEAYRSLIDPSRYPVAFLYLSLDPAEVDLNVHPTKVEVRWRDSNYVHSQVLAALRDKFLSTNLDHRLKPPSDQGEYRERVREAMVDFFLRRGDDGQQRRFEKQWAGTAQAGNGERETGNGERHGAPRPPAVPTGNGERHGAPRPSAVSAGAPQSSAVSVADPIDTTGGSVLAVPAGPQIDATPSADPPPLVRAIQVHNTYLVVETDEGVMIIDQHALHERILYEELRRRIADRALESQRMLIPEIVRVPPDRIEVLETHAATLARLGVELSPTSAGSVALNAFPLLLERADRQQFVSDLLDLLAEQGVRPQADTLLHKLLDMMACKAAVKAGDPLNADEITALLHRRELAERSSHCPHGRPTTLHLTLRELEKQFKRR
ncbi:MAG: DNA mismatch repair endonuclease MutL [Phycisphaerae bacterium]